MYTISIKKLRSATVTNVETKVVRECKVEPYHRDGKPMAYVVLHDGTDKSNTLKAPIRRFNITNFTGPVELKNVDLQARSRSTGVDWSTWGAKK